MCENSWNNVRIHGAKARIHSTKTPHFSFLIGTKTNGTKSQNNISTCRMAQNKG